VRGLKPIQILLAEDNPDDVDLARRALRKARVANELHVVWDGQEALDFLFRKNGYAPDAPRPDLILLDLNMPRLSGIEVLEKIRASEGLSFIPVIILTASGRGEDVLKSYRLGANTYIEKPVDFARFMHAIEVLGEYWIAVAKLPPQTVVFKQELPETR
jgi:CheY-like chemotaxis protein